MNGGSFRDSRCPDPPEITRIFYDGAVPVHFVAALKWSVICCPKSSLDYIFSCQWKSEYSYKSCIVDWSSDGPSREEYKANVAKERKERHQDRVINIENSGKSFLWRKFSRLHEAARHWIAKRS
jgi:hypothetical protein